MSATVVPRAGAQARAVRRGVERAAPRPSGPLARDRRPTSRPLQGPETDVSAAAESRCETPLLLPGGRVFVGPGRPLVQQQRDLPGGRLLQPVARQASVADRRHDAVTRRARAGGISSDVVAGAQRADRGLALE